MKRSAVLPLLMLLLPATAQAAPWAHVTYRPDVTNHQMDCWWGFFCEGPIPLFHFHTQDQLGRVDGWARYGWMRQGSHTISFELFASHYASAADGAAAYTDLLDATGAHMYTPLGGSPSLLPAGFAGSCVTRLHYSGSMRLILMACRQGVYEVESLVMFHHATPGARATATAGLADQMRRALIAGVFAESSGG